MQKTSNIFNLNKTGNVLATELDRKTFVGFDTLCCCLCFYQRQTHKKYMNVGDNTNNGFKYKAPWLDEVIARGDNIRLVSDPTKELNLYVNGKDASGGLTTFGMEIDYLKKNGYEFVDGYAVKIK